MIDTQKVNNAVEVGKNWGMIQSGSVLTGILYSIIFLLMIPTFMNQGYTFDNMLINTGIMLLAAIIIHFLINGLYYLIIVVPLIMAVIFAVGGWLIWLFTPFLFSSIQLILVPLGILLDINLDFANLSEFCTRVGQTFMIFGGGLWWIVKKAKDINYAAMYIYIIIIAILGVVSGFISPSITILFIIFWATLSYKIHENPNVDVNKQLGYLFKVVANLAILFATFKNLYYANNTWYGETSYGLVIYSIIVFLLVSFGIWKPGIIKKYIPVEGQNIARKLLKLFQKFVFLGK